MAYFSVNDDRYIYVTHAIGVREHKDHREYAEKTLEETINEVVVGKYLSSITEKIQGNPVSYGEKQPLLVWRMRPDFHLDADWEWHLNHGLHGLAETQQQLHEPERYVMICRFVVIPPDKAEGAREQIAARIKEMQDENTN